MSIFRGKLAGWLFKGSSTPAENSLWSFNNTSKTWDIRSLLTAIAHAMTSAGHTAGNWKVFHSNGSGAVAELALGADNTVLKSTGASTAPEFAAVAESEVTFTDITTNDVSTTKHGFVPKAPNDTTKFLRGDATWAVPSVTVVTRKTADESVTSATLQDDDHLSFSIAANEIWAVDILLRIAMTAAGGGFRCTFTLPSGASMLLQAESIEEGGVETSAVGTTPGTAIVLVNAGTLMNYVKVKGLLVNSTNAGTAQFQWAQGAAGGTTTVYTNSHMLRTKL